MTKNGSNELVFRCRYFIKPKLQRHQKLSIRLVEESSSSQTSSSDYNKASKTITNRDQTITVSSPTSSESDEMKRAIAKKLIERYFYQLSDGCGKPNCANKNCASSGSVEALSPNQAAARAIQLYSQEAELCELHPAKVAKTQDSRLNIDDSSGYVICLCFALRFCWYCLEL